MPPRTLAAILLVPLTVLGQSIECGVPIGFPSTVNNCREILQNKFTGGSGATSTKCAVFQEGDCIASILAQPGYESEATWDFLFEATENIMNACMPGWQNTQQPSSNKGAGQQGSNGITPIVAVGSKACPQVDNVIITHRGMPEATHVAAN